MAGQVFTTLQEYRATLNASDFKRGTEEVERGSTKAVGAIDRLIGKFDRLQAAENKRATGLAEVGRLFERGLTDGREAEAIQKIENSFSKATGSAEKFTVGLGTMRTALGALGVAVSAQAFIGFGKAAFETAANLNEVAQQAGVGAEALQAYRAIMAEGGIATAQADTIITRFTRSIGEARDGAKAQSEAFRTLGVSARDLAGGPEAAFPKAIAGLLAIPDAADRARIETDLFARSGQQLESVLRTMSGSTEEMIARGKEMGLVLSSDLTDAADKAADQMTEAWTRARVALTPYAIMVAQVVANLAEMASRPNATPMSPVMAPAPAALQALIGAGGSPGLAIVGAIQQGMRDPAAPTMADRRQTAAGAGIPFRAGGRSTTSTDFEPDFTDQFDKYQRDAELLARDALEQMQDAMRASNAEMQADIKSKQKFADEMRASNVKFLANFKVQNISKPGGVGAFGSVVPILGGKKLTDHSEEINALADFHKEAKERWDDYHKRTAEGQRDWTDNFVSSLDFAFDNLTRQIARGKTDLSDLRDVAATVVQGMLADFMKLTVLDPLKEAAGGFLKSFVGGLAGGFAGGGGVPSGGVTITPSPITGGYSSGFAGGFAEGGTIGAGKWGIVGEKGEEIVHAGTAGATVTPMSKQQAITITINAPGADGNTVERIRAVVHEEMVPAINAAVAGGAAVGYGAVSRRLRYSGRGGL